MSEVESREEYERLLESLERTRRIAEESQAEAAAYLKLLEECWRAASEALRNNELSLLYTITGKPSFDWVPSEQEGKQWGKLFLHACMRDARWLKHAKKRLEEIREHAELIVEDTESNAELKRKIIEAADDGLIIHI